MEEIKKAAKGVEEVVSVSEVQVYYKDNGEIASKVDIVLAHSLTIKQAHSIAGKEYAPIESTVVSCSVLLYRK